LPLQDGSFDLVTTVGSISYCDCDLLIGEICRMLKPSGTWIFVDSYNFNPIYRVNRVIRFWRGELSRSVILRIPDRRTIQSLRLHFNDVEVSYYGIFSFLGPFLSRILGETSAASIINGLDEHLPFLKQFAFKIVVTARK
jgi:SAM-dependent methyltransferase